MPRISCHRPLQRGSCWDSGCVHAQAGKRWMNTTAHSASTWWQPPARMLRSARWRAPAGHRGQRAHAGSWRAGGDLRKPLRLPRRAGACRDWRRWRLRGPAGRCTAVQACGGGSSRRRRRLRGPADVAPGGACVAASNCRKRSAGFAVESEGLQGRIRPPPQARFFSGRKRGGCRTTGRQPEQAQAGSPSAGESPRLRTPSAFLPPTSNPHPGPAPAAQRGGGAHWQFLMLLVTPVTNSQFPPCHGAGLESSSMCGGGARQPATAGAACDLVGAGLVRDTHWQHTELRHFSRRASCLPDPAQRDSRG